jgi:C-terminal processing protease CtpA/Prc
MDAARSRGPVPESEEVSMKPTVTLLALTMVFALVTAAFAGGNGQNCDTKDAAHAKAAHAKKAELAAKGWLGIDTQKDEATGAYRVSKIAAGSPAEQAGFRVGDVLVAFNGIPVKDKERIKAAKASIAVGSQVSYTVARAGAEQRLTATLAPVPDQVLAEWMAKEEKEAKAQVASAN